MIFYLCILICFVEYILVVVGILCMFIVGKGILILFKLKNSEGNRDCVYI